MDATTTLNVVLAVASVVAAGVAVWQAVEAKQARDDAGKHADRALLASERQSDAQEAIAARLTPEPWGELSLVSGQLYATKNTSGKPLTVTAAFVTPEEAQPLVRIRTSVPGVIEPGETFSAMLPGRWGLSIETLAIEWTSEDGESSIARLAKP